MFAENLPESCPPQDASSAAITTVYRLVKVADPDESAFASLAALGKVKPPEHKATDCEWASCSMFVSEEAALAIKGLRKRHPYVVRLSLPENAGRHQLRGEHVDFWRFASFPIAASIVDVWKHEQ